MHLKILIGVLILGIATANPKAAPKPIPKPKPITKASPQYYQGYPGAQPNYLSGASSYFGQQFNQQPILGQDALGYNPGFAPSGYQSPFGNNFGSQAAYPQGSLGNYYQTPQATAGSYYQSPQAAGSSYYQSPQAPGATYYQPPQGPAANFYQPSQAPAANLYQPSQAPAANLYQPSQAPASNFYQPTQAPGANFYQPSPTPAANFQQSPQASPGNYFQPSQLIPVPVGYPGGSSVQNPPVGNPSSSLVQSVPSVGPPGGSPVQSPLAGVLPGGNVAQSVQPPNYSGGARLWPKVLISPAGSPSPVPDNLARAYYGVSTPSPSGYSLPTQSSDPLSQQNLIPVPVKVGSRNHFQPEITNYNSLSQNYPFPSSTPAPVPFDQRYTQPSNQPGYSFSTPNSPYATNQQPSSSHYPVNYQSSPAPFQVNYPQSTSASAAQPNYQSTPSPSQGTLQQQFSSVSYPFNYQQPTPAPNQGNYQLPGQSSGSLFADYQQQATGSPYAAQYQAQGVSPIGPTSSPYRQRIPVPVAYPQSPIEFQPNPPTLVTPTKASTVTPTPTSTAAPATSFPNVPLSSKPIIVLPTTPTPIKEISITENTFIPIPTTSSPLNKAKAKIIKSEYSGTVSPQYNKIPLFSTSFKNSTPTPFLDEAVGKSSYGLSHAPEKALANNSAATAVSHITFKGLGNNYSF